jgi:hypothetical protein
MLASFQTGHHFILTPACLPLGRPAVGWQAGRLWLAENDQQIYCTALLGATVYKSCQLETQTKS